MNTYMKTSLNLNIMITKRRGVAEQYYKREADWKEASERAKRTSERVYCRIISMGRAIARSYRYYPHYTRLFIEVYANMQVVKKPYRNMIPCKSYSVP